MSVEILIDRAMPEVMTDHIVATIPEWATWRALDRADAEFGPALATADVLLHVLDPISASDIAAAPRLKLIHKLGAGVNTIDRAAAAANGVAVANMPGINAPAVAEHALMLLLAVLRKLPVQHRGTVASTAWPTGPDAPGPTTEIVDLQVGLIGYGAIGQRFENALVALGATVFHHSRTTDRPGWLALDELVESVDVISLHLPLTEETTAMLDENRIRSMRPGAIVINTARGGLIDQVALTAALADGHLGGAGLDVFDPEPPAGDDVLLSLPNVVVTPHSAWMTAGTLRRCWDRALENCRRLRDGKPLADVIAFE